MNYGNKLELFFSVHPRLHRQLMFGELWVWSLWGGWTTSLQAVISCVVSLSALISGPLSATEISVVLAVNANLMCCVSIVLVGVWYRLSTGGPEDMKAKNKAQCSAQTLCDFSSVLEPVSVYMKTHTHMVSSARELSAQIYDFPVKAFFLSSIRHTRHWALQNCSYHRTIQTCSNYYVELCASVKVTTTMFLQSKQSLLKALKQGCWTYFTSRTT